MSKQIALPMSEGPAAVEFFAGIGLARMGLEQAGFQVTWSNDIEPAKKNLYEAHFDSSNFLLRDVTKVDAGDLPRDPHRKISLAWASSPCVDVSLAGARAGMKGERSSTFFEFTRVLGEMSEDDRPRVMTLENVVGLATSNKGEDLAAAIKELNGLGYSVDVLTLDARWFVPQSRPRLFLVGVWGDPEDHPDANPTLRPAWLQAPFSSKSLRTHRAKLPDIEPASTVLSAVVEKVADDDAMWWNAQRLAAFRASLSDIQAERIKQLQKTISEPVYRTAYRRTRNGIPMWEVRADDIAGCLRTTRGGSSKQALVEISKSGLRARWMTAREYSRLMGADDYTLGVGARPSQALFGFGDAVCVPAVAWLAEHYLMPEVRRLEIEREHGVSAAARA